MKKKIILTEEKITNKAYDEPHINLQDFESNLNIQILSSCEDKLVLQIDHIDPPIANALRRIMIADVLFLFFTNKIPTMAIHKVWVMQNTSIIPDEVLSHRLGLIPIKVDPRLFQYKKGCSYDELQSRMIIMKETLLNLNYKSNVKDKPNIKTRNQMSSWITLMNILPTHRVELIVQIQFMPPT